MIKKVKSLKEIEKFLDKTTLLALDLDDTLVTASSYFGSFLWGREMFERYLKRGYKNARERAVRKWQEAQNRVRLELVEEGSLDFLKRWHEKAFYIVGLTARSREIEVLTVRELARLGIELKEILFCSNVPKSEFLFNFIDCELLTGEVKKIVAVDDIMHHLENISYSCEKKGIDFIGFHFIRKKGDLDEGLLL